MPEARPFEDEDSDLSPDVVADDGPQSSSSPPATFETLNQYNLIYLRDSYDAFTQPAVHQEHLENLDVHQDASAQEATNSDQPLPTENQSVSPPVTESFSVLMEDVAEDNLFGDGLPAQPPQPELQQMMDGSDGNRLLQEAANFLRDPPPINPNDLD